MDTITAALRTLDPAPATKVTEEESRRRAAMLERVVALPQAVAPAGRAPRFSSRRRFAMAGALALLVVPAAVIGVHAASRQLDPTSHDLANADLASWVSSATPRTASQLTHAAKQWCIIATDDQAGAAAPVSIAGGDQRGDVASMVIHRGVYTDICLANKAGGGGAWEIVSGPNLPLAPIPARDVLMQSSGAQGSNSIGTAWGQAGSDVQTITVHLGNRDVNAVITDGIWSTWWPATRVGGFARTATVTYSDGRTATIPVRAP